MADGRVCASVDVGSTSVHLLVARVAGHRLEPLADESVFLGLGDRVGAVGYLGREARAGLVDALATYAARARALGAGRDAIAFVGTEPMRVAADAATVTHEVERATAVPLHVATHAEEGMLTLLGVMAGAAVAHELVVVDVGGGSSEVVVAGPGRPPETAGVRVGASRLTQRLVRDDPPSTAEIAALRADARRLVAEAPAARPEELVVVGGTASNLVKVLPDARDGRLTGDLVEEALAYLVTEPSARVAERYPIRPARARILPAGAAIVLALLERYGVDALRVSEAGIREGAVHALAASGRAWRDRLPCLVLGPTAPEV